MLVPAEDGPAVVVVGSTLHAVSWNLTQRCNLRCEHCYLNATARAAAHSEQLTREECHEVVCQLSEINPRLFLILTGGEPLLHPYLRDIVADAASFGMTVVLGTNATQITEGVAADLKEAGLSGAGVSLDSVEPSLHDQLRGVSGAWRRAMDGIEAMRKVELDFLVQTSIFSWNRHQLAPMAELARDLGATALNLYFLVCTGRGQELTDLSPVEYEAALEAIYLLQERMRGELLIGVKCAPHYKRIVHQHDPDSPFLASYQGGCPAATHYCRIDPSGQVTPCPYMPADGESLRERPLAEIWERSPRFVELRARRALDGRCGDCEFNELCGGCRARALAVTGEAMAEDPSCVHQPQVNDGPSRVRVSEDRTFGLEDEPSLSWSVEASERLSKVPSFIRGMAIRGVEKAAREAGLGTVTVELMQQVRRQSMASGGGLPQPGRVDRGLVSDAVTWSEEARRRVEDAPAFVRPGIVKLMEIRARTRGHAVIGSDFLSEIRNESMLRVAKVIRRFGFEELTEEAFTEAKHRMRKNVNKVGVIGQIEGFLADRTTKNREILDKFRRYLDAVPAKGLPWTPEALEWLGQVAGSEDELKTRIERHARQVKAPVVSLELIQELRTST